MNLLELNFSSNYVNRINKPPNTYIFWDKHDSDDDN